MSYKTNDDLENKSKIILDTEIIDQIVKTEVRFGATCPKCTAGKFDYDGMLNLVCSNCGYTSGGCFT